MSQSPTLPQRSADDDYEGWQAHWKAQGQPWRTEPEIDAERQEYLEERRIIQPDFIQCIYPFKDIKLSRADIEWLLATHENGRGPIDWSDESQHKREGLDLRGADLREEDLSKLPLANMRGGLGWNELSPYKFKHHSKQLEAAAIHAEEANFHKTDLRGATLRAAHLNQTYLEEGYLEAAELIEANLKGADLSKAQSNRASFFYAQLENAHFYFAHLEGADLSGAHLEDASLFDTYLKGAEFTGAHLEGAIFSNAHLEGADLRNAFFDSVTTFENVKLCDEKFGCALLCDVRWGDVNLSWIKWGLVKMLGDEQVAKQRNTSEGEVKDRDTHAFQFKLAVQANRQLAVVLRNQGLNEDAARFAYRAQMLQRTVFKLQKKFGQYLFSLFLDLLAGHGYKPWRSFATYIVVIGIFATIYLLLGQHLAWNEAIVISMTAFHGRGFFPTQFQPGDPQALVAAIEAFVGLLIEVTFIATLTRRLFGK